MKRFLILAFALLMIVPCAVLLSACGEPSTTGYTDGDLYVRMKSEDETIVSAKIGEDYFVSIRTESEETSYLFAEDKFYKMEKTITAGVLGQGEWEEVEESEVPSNLKPAAYFQTTLNKLKKSSYHTTNQYNKLNNTKVIAGYVCSEYVKAGESQQTETDKFYATEDNFVLQAETETAEFVVEAFDTNPSWNKHAIAMPQA